MVFRKLYFFILNVIVVILLLSGFNSCNKEIVPPSFDDIKTYAPCVIPGNFKEFEIVTFNAGGFPKDGYNSVAAIASLIKTIDPDIVAFQEISSVSDFERLVKLMPGWTGILNPVDNDEWDLAYLVKSSEIEFEKSSSRLLFEDDKWSFPRSPFEISIKHHTSNEKIFLINLHLKCCGGSDNENSRKSASLKLKNYLDVTRKSDKVIVLGDYNDEILSASASENPFLNFINDPLNYMFADMKIAKGSALWWSYPSYPSHIDHIMVTNELFSPLDTTFVLKVSPCFNAYESILSDHRPVETRFKFNY